MITTVKHAVVPIQDQDRALKFYTEKLGFKVVVDLQLESYLERLIELETPEGDTRVVFYLNDEHKDMIGKVSNIVFTCKNVAATSEQLKENGVEIIEGPVQESWGMYSIFKDSEGNRFCLSSS